MNREIEKIEINQKKTSYNTTIQSNSSPRTTSSSSWSSNFFSHENISNIANTMSVLLAAAIFSIPWSFYQAGIIGGIIIICIASFISCITILILLSVQRQLYHQTGIIFNYPELASEYLQNTHWGVSIQIATTISCLGGCAGFFIFIGQISAQQLKLPLTQTILLLCIPMILLSWIRSFKELSIFTIIGVSSIVISVFVIFFEGFPVHSDQLVVHIFDPMESLGFLGNATFLFTVHYCILAMGAEVLHHHHEKRNQQVLYQEVSSTENGMRTAVGSVGGGGGGVNGQRTTPSISSEGSNESEIDEIPDTLTVPVTVAFIFGTVVVGALGLTGPLIYSGTPLVRDSTGQIIEGCEQIVCQNIVLNLPEGILRSIVGVILIISIMITYMLLLAPAREHIEKYLLNILQPSSTLLSDWIRNIIRSLLVLGTAFIALQAPYFGSVLRTVGGLTDAYQSYIIPPLVAIQFYSLHFNHFHSQSDGKYILFYRIVFCWGLCLMGFTFYQTVLSIMKYP